jgi:hypothetical protein
MAAKFLFRILGGDFEKYGFGSLGGASDLGRVGCGVMGVKMTIFWKILMSFKIVWGVT